MLTLPAILERTAAPYIAVKRHVTLPFDDEIPAIMGELFEFVSANKLQEAGPVFFKHNVIAMPEIEMEFAVPVDRLVPGGGAIVSGTLPAGRYLEISYFGRYDDLLTVNGILVGWAAQAGLALDSRPEEKGEWFAARSEIYHNSPAEEPDPAKLHTTVSIKLKE